MLQPKVQLLGFVRRVINRISRMRLEKNQQLWQELTSYLEKTKSTGCSYIDYWVLYNTIRVRKPTEVLECGPGVSTLIISYALMENDKEGYPGRVTSMEELEIYYKLAIDLLPNYLEPYVDFVLSPRIEDYYSLFRGVRYRDIPQDRTYDFVFVDGPNHTSPVNEEFVFDFDYIYILKNSQRTVSAIVDYRLSTCYVLQILLGLDKVKFNAIQELGFVEPCTQDDLLQLELESLTSNLLRDANFFGSTEVRLR